MLIKVIEIAKAAGKIILEEYDKPAVVDWKSDDSPLTQADRKSHDFIQQSLLKAFPDIPVLSEEGADISYSERKQWKRFWCVDPIDGTKEFIKKTAQYTVNIALIEDNIPVLGVIHVPALSLTYFADKNNGAFKLTSENIDDKQRITIKPLDVENIEVVASRDHAGPKVQDMIDKLSNPTTKSMGSSLKFCLVAEGQADVYLRDVPTFEWDTAAAQAIVEEAGGCICTLDGKTLTYNKENLRNPSIITFGKDWNFWSKIIS